MDNLDYIENYFTKTPNAEEAGDFEKRIGSDPAFAEEVAYYLSVLQVSREESRTKQKANFKEIYLENRMTAHIPVRKLVYSLAAAAVVVGLIFGVYIFVKPIPIQQLAGQYIQDHLQTQGVTMSGKMDSLQNGLRLYNDGKSDEALLAFEQIIQSDTSNFTAKKYAGLAALRMKNYDKAIRWFESLETYSGLYANPAQFYLALTLMDRNQSGDAEKAKQLLQKVVDQDLEGKETAQEWLKKLD
jgi:tetratricopeptide (TPR) repeat protein